MKSAIYSLIMMILLSLSSFSINSVDSKEEAKPESTLSRKEGVRHEQRVVASVGADGVQRVEMVGGDYYYNPNYLVVKVNKPVEIKIRKTTSYVPHNLIAKAPEAGIDFKIDLKSDIQTVNFTPTKIGKYPIYCDEKMFWFKSHRERGMEGMIEVIE